MSQLQTLDLDLLASVTGGLGAGTENPEPAPQKPSTGSTIGSYAGACAAGAARGAITGGAIGAITTGGPGVLPGAGVGALTGCVTGMVGQSTPAY
jgi:hypothetical protein